MTGPIPELRIRLAKRPDGSVVLHCTRADGSATWQRHDPRRAAFFAHHDLRHFAVETTLGLRRGFFGLIADGWDIANTDGKGDRGRLPPDAIVAEYLVGLLDRENIGGSPALRADEVWSLLREHAPCAEAVPMSLTDATLASIRTLASALHEQWVKATDALELSYDRRATAS